MSDIFLATMNVLAGLIDVYEPISTVGVISFEEGDLEKRTRALLGLASPPAGKKGGAYSLVVQTRGTPYRPKDHAPVAQPGILGQSIQLRFLQLDYVTLCIENYIYNRSAQGSKIPAQTLAENVAAAVDQKPNGQNFAGWPGKFGPNFYLSEDAILRQSPMHPLEIALGLAKDSLIIWEVRCHTFVSLNL